MENSSGRMSILLLLRLWKARLVLMWGEDGVGQLGSEPGTALGSDPSILQLPFPCQ